MSVRRCLLLGGRGYGLPQDLEDLTFAPLYVARASVQERTRAVEDEEGGDSRDIHRPLEVRVGIGEDDELPAVGVYRGAYLLDVGALVDADGVEGDYNQQNEP